VFAVACSSSGSSPIENTVSPTPTTQSSTPSAPTADDVSSDGNQIAFGEEILPILEDHCALCHAPAAPGSTHVLLSIAADAAANAFAIGQLVDQEKMPPWPASNLSVDFVGDHSLTEEQRNLVVQWSNEGGGIDVLPDIPIKSSRLLATIPDPDLVVTSSDGPYQGSTDVLDDYRCVIFDPEVQKTEWILASHFEPDKLEVVHHGIFTLASSHYRAQAEALDGADSGVGWTCYGGTGLEERVSGGYQFGFGGWAPGDPPDRSPEGYATPLRSGDFFIIQLHYHFDDEAPPDLSRMLFDFANDEEIDANGGFYKTLTGQLFLGPAEIPCYIEDANPLCNRDIAMERVVDLYGPRGKLSNFFNSQCGFTPEDYAHMTDGTASSSCDRRVTAPGKIVKLAGHMHELGLSIRLTLNPDTDTERILLDIPDWDFQWQFDYHPVEEIILKNDDIIRVDCSWNRERAPYKAVGYILWALGTGDEMCYSAITTAPITG
jgi:hypothetical protein